MILLTIVTFGIWTIVWSYQNGDELKAHARTGLGGVGYLLKDRVTDLTGFASNVVNPFDQMQLGSGVREPRVRREAPWAARVRRRRR